MANSLADLRLRSKQRCNQENRTLLSESEWTGLINDAVGELYDLVVATNPAYYLRSFNFTLAAVNTLDLTTLPGGFYKLRGVDYLASAQRPVTLHPFNFGERNRQGYRAYSVDYGSSLAIQPPTNFAGNYTIWYTPTPPQFEHAKFTVRLATVAALPSCISLGVGPAHSLNALANGALTVDGAAAVQFDRVLVKNEVSTKDNGIYTVTNAGSAGTPWGLQRAADYDENAEIANGDMIRVTAGAVNAGAVFRNASTVINIDVSPLAFGLDTFANETLDAILDVWSEYIVVTAAIAGAIKEESPIDSLGAVKSLMIDRINKAVPNRDGEPGQAADLTSPYGPDDWAY